MLLVSSELFQEAVNTDISERWLNKVQFMQVTAWHHKRRFPTEGTFPRDQEPEIGAFRRDKGLNLVLG